MFIVNLKGTLGLDDSGQAKFTVASGYVDGRLLLNFRFARRCQLPGQDGLRRTGLRNKRRKTPTRVWSPRWTCGFCWAITSSRKTWPLSPPSARLPSTSPIRRDSGTGCTEGTWHDELVLAKAHRAGVGKLFSDRAKTTF